MHTLGFSEAKKEHWGWGPPVVKPNFLSLPTSSPFKSSFCKWHHQFSHLLKPKSLKSSLTYFSLPQSIQQQICCCHFWNMFTVRPVFSTLVVSTEVSYLECSICCLNDFSSSTIVLLNSVFLLAARTVVKKKKIEILCWCQNKVPCLYPSYKVHDLSDFMSYFSLLCSFYTIPTDFPAVLPTYQTCLL